VNQDERPDQPEFVRALRGEPADVAGEDRAQLVSRLFQEHNRALVSFLTARLHCEQEARDVAQEAYVRLLQLQEPGAVSFLKAYLFRIASNLAVDRLRQRAVHGRVLNQDQDLFAELTDPHTTERHVLAEQELEQIGERLEQLPESCRYAFVRHVLLDRPVKDIARDMGLTERMVRYHIVRALMFCREAREGMKS
jgi:RNA polymerase sigma-70 factor (ECF subfamily)